jgi:hypothetical protein
MMRVLRRNGFEITDIRVSYGQTDYFAFLLPLYLLVALFEMVLMALGLKNLAATVLITARRTEAPLNQENQRLTTVSTAG